MSKNKKKIVYENKMLPSGVSISEIEFRTPSGSEFAPRFAVRQTRDTVCSISDDRIVQRKSYRIGNMNYIVNSCFERCDARPAEDGVKYLLGLDAEKNIEKAS